MGKSDFRGIVLPGKHRFAEKHPPDLHAIKPAGQKQMIVFIGIPAFKRMRMADAVQLVVGYLKRRCDPAAALMRPGRGGAGGNHGREVLVDRYRVMPVAHGLGQRAADVQPPRGQHRARGGGKPKKQAILLKPREDALLISRQKPLRR